MHRVFKYCLLLLLVLNFALSLAQKKFKIDSLLQKINGNSNDTTKVLALNKLAALTVYDSGAYSLKLAKQATGLAQKINYKIGEAKTLYRQGIIFNLSFREHDSSFKYCLQALKISEQLKDTLQMADIYQLMGSIHMGQRHFDKSEAAFLLSEKYYLRTGQIEKMTWIYTGMAEQYRLNGKRDSSLKTCRKAIALFEKTHNDYGRADMLSAMGSILIEQNKFEEALVKYKEANVLNKKLERTHNYIYSLLCMAMIHSDMNNSDLVQPILDTALAISIKNQDVNNTIFSYRELSNHYIKIKNFEKASYYLQKYINSTDSINRLDEVSQVANMETDYLQEKEAAIRLLEKQKQNIITYALSGGLILVLLLAIFIYRGYAQKQKANLAILEQKHLVEEKQKEILDSIKYARRIQSALITNEKYIDKSLNRLNNS